MYPLFTWSITVVCHSQYGWAWNSLQVSHYTKHTSFELLTFISGGHSTFFALLNTFVHIVMYFYYMISAMGPEYQKYIWWKKYLTSFQMLQFVAIFAHQFQLLFTECDYPKTFMIWIAIHGLMFLFLFSDFYKVNYSKVPKKENQGACMVSQSYLLTNQLNVAHHFIIKSLRLKTNYNGFFLNHIN